MLGAQLEQVRGRIAQACQRASRAASDVILIGVTKGVPADTIREAIAAGLTDVGENRIQEAQGKKSALDEVGGRVRWHLVGHLQRNKAKDAVRLFDVVHSIDSLDLAEELERQAAKRDRTTDVFMQVNVSKEVTKFGCSLNEAGALACSIVQLPHLNFQGLMTMAPFNDNAEQSRPHFRQLRELRDDLQSKSQITNHQLQLSMGMSQDFEVAIEEGADFVRVGTAIFGTQKEMGQGA